MFTMNESRAISHANDTEQQAERVTGNLHQQRFSTETLWRTPTKIHLERRGQQEATKL